MHYPNNALSAAQHPSTAESNFSKSGRQSDQFCQGRIGITITIPEQQSVLNSDGDLHLVSSAFDTHFDTLVYALADINRSWMDFESHYNSKHHSSFFPPAGVSPATISIGATCPPVRHLSNWWHPRCGQLFLLGSDICC